MAGRGFAAKRAMRGRGTARMVALRVSDSDDVTQFVPIDFGGNHDGVVAADRWGVSSRELENQAGTEEILTGIIDAIHTSALWAQLAAYAILYDDGAGNFSGAVQEARTDVAVPRLPGDVTWKWVAKSQLGVWPTPSSGDSLLLESGGALLLESGDHLLLESA